MAESSSCHFVVVQNLEVFGMNGIQNNLVCFIVLVAKKKKIMISSSIVMFGQHLLDDSSGDCALLASFLVNLVHAMTATVRKAILY